MQFNQTLKLLLNYQLSIKEMKSSSYHIESVLRIPTEETEFIHKVYVVTNRNTNSA